MVTQKQDIATKFENGDIPSQEDFKEIFDSFVHKDDDKASIAMVEVGIDDEHYITPALLRASIQNLGLITGNCYMPYKESYDGVSNYNNFDGISLYLKKSPIIHSVKIFKNGQLLVEGVDEDYAIDYDTAVITFTSDARNRNIEVDYWYKNIGSSSDAETGGSYSYMPYKESYEPPYNSNNYTNFDGTTLTLKKIPANYSIKAFKEGQLFLEGEDYSVNYDTGVLTFSSEVTDRNIEVDYWYKNLNTISGPGADDYVDLTTDQTIEGNKIFTDNVSGNSFIKSGGTSSQYLMADGSVKTSIASDYDAGHSGFNMVSIAGYQKFSNGLILQWAYLNSGSNTYTFPLSWPNRSFSVVLSTNRTSPGSSGYNHVANITNTSYYAVIDGTYGYMFAIGY